MRSVVADTHVGEGGVLHTTSAQGSPPVEALLVALLLAEAEEEEAEAEEEEAEEEPPAPDELEAEALEAPAEAVVEEPPLPDALEEDALTPPSPPVPLVVAAPPSPELVVPSSMLLPDAQATPPRGKQESKNKPQYARGIGRIEQPHFVVTRRGQGASLGSGKSVIHRDRMKEERTSELLRGESAERGGGRDQDRSRRLDEGSRPAGECRTGSRSFLPSRVDPSTRRRLT